MAADVEVYQRPLKKAKLGVPDIYPQEAKQGEDDLSERIVKNGFTNKLAVSNEHGSAHTAWDAADLGKFAQHYNKIITLKQKQNTFQDTKRKLQLNKENFWHYTARSKPQLQQWLQDLSGPKPLSQLAKKVPLFHKKDEIMGYLAEYNIPFFRASWFLKMANAAQNNLVESKVKKRQTSEPLAEWTHIFIKFLKEQIVKLSEYYTQPYSNLNQRPPPEIDTAGKNWSYGILLGEWMMEDNLLDKHDFFSWAIELVDKYKTNNDDVLFKHILPFLMRHLETVISSQLMARSLCSNAVNKLNILNSNAENMQSSKDEEQIGQELKANALLGRTSPLLPMFTEYKECRQHHTIVTILTGMIQVITLRCPTALIYNICKVISPTDPTKTQVIGSPLDKLPCFPSDLILDVYPENEDEAKQQSKLEVRMSLVTVENEIQRRSIAVEKRWLSQANENTKSTTEGNQDTLDILDQINYNIANSTGIGEAVHEALFMNKDGLEMSEDQFEADKPTILLLCEWATSKMRHGKHRSLVAASVIKLRQNYITEKINEEPPPDEETELNPTYPYQSILLEFLDTYQSHPDLLTCHYDESFQQLVLLFGELIRYDVFSHDEYLCSLVSRGDLCPSALQKITNTTPKEKKKSATTTASSLSTTLHTASTSHRFESETPRFELDNEFMDPHSDLQNILIGTPIGNAPPLFGMLPHSPVSSAAMPSSPVDKPDERKERHVLNALHFPIPSVDENSHDKNQRLVLLFGVGKRRDTEINKVKSLVDSLYVMFDLDVAFGQKSVNSLSADTDKRSDLLRQFGGLSLHDQWAISTKFSMILQNMKHQSPINFGVCGEIPFAHQVSLLFDFLEISQNIQGLIDFIAFLVTPHKHAVNVSSKATYVNGKKSDKLLQVVAMVRKYYSCVLNSSEVTGTIFRGLLQTVENIADPGQCHSTQRCVLVMLHDMYDTCLHLKHRFADIFSIASGKIHDAICAAMQPACTSGLQWDTSYLNEYFREPRKKPLEPIWLEHLNNAGAAELFSFVCNAVLAITKCKDVDKVYDISLLCCEVTSHVSSLCKEWLGVVKAICCCSTAGLGFEELLSAISMDDSKVQQTLTFFVCILVAHHCMNLDDFLQKVAIPALEVSPSKDAASVVGIRLTCLMLEQLLEDHMERESRTNALVTCRHEHYLLVGELNKVSIEDIMIVLKRLLVAAENAPPPPLQNIGDSHNDEVFESLFNSESINLSQNSELFDTPFTEKKLSNIGGDHEVSLSKVVNNCLHFISSRSWMQLKILRNEHKQLLLKGLVDPELKPYQVQNFTSILINKLPNKAPPQFEDYQQATNRICKNLDKWSLHHACLEMQLLIKVTSKEETNRLLSAIGRAVMATLTEEQENFSSTNLICPLVSKLSTNIQAKILRSASETMEKGKWWNPSGSAKQTLNSQKTLFMLISTCLRGQEENKSVFLGSILKQFQAFVAAPEDEKIDIGSSEIDALLDAIHLRLNLVGMLFDLIIKTPAIIFDWTLVLFQILASEVIPPTDFNHERGFMFTDLTDMIVILMSCVKQNETVQQQNSQGSTCEVQKFSSLIKKMRKELSNKGATEISQHCEELLPLHTPLCEIVTMEPIHLSDTSSQSNSPLNKDRTEWYDPQVEYGLRRTGVQYISPWELIGDSKNIAPLSLSMFGAVKVEKRPLRYIEEAFRLIHHTHQRKKPLSYFLNASPEEEDEKESGNRSQTGTPVAATSSSSAGPATPATSQNMAGPLPTTANDPSVKASSSSEVIVGEPTNILPKPKQPAEVQQRRNSQSQKHTLSRSSSLPTSHMVESKQRKLQQLTHAQSLGTDMRLAPTGAGPNDTTKTALQNLINNRKLSGSGVQSLQAVQQLSMQQQQQQQQQAQNPDMFQPQRSYSVAPNVNISEALQQSPANTMTNVQQRMKLQARMNSFRNPQQMMGQQQQQGHPSLHDLLVNAQNQRPMITPEQQMLRESLLQQQQFQRMQLSNQSVQVQSQRMQLAANQGGQVQVPPMQNAQIQSIKAGAQQQQQHQQRNQQMFRQMQMQMNPMMQTAAIPGMQRQMPMQDEQFQTMQAQSQGDMSMFQPQMTANANEFQPQMMMPQQFPRQMQPGAQFPHQGF